jgi:hypothetical protein
MFLQGSLGDNGSYQKPWIFVYGWKHESNEGFFIFSITAGRTFSFLEIKQ